jgi:hypothetical protein
VSTDPVIEQLEAELHESRFKAWDVETFLANRHQAKIEALTDPESKWRQRWQVTKEVATAISAMVGYVTVATIAGLWLVTGEFPLHRQVEQAPILALPPSD